MLCTISLEFYNYNQCTNNLLPVCDSWTRLGLVAVEAHAAHSDCGRMCLSSELKIIGYSQRWFGALVKLNLLILEIAFHFMDGK